MKELSMKFPQYCWDQNKGYPTAAHIEAVREYGQCKWHRKTFICKVLQQD
jgi:ribonuclease HII